MRIRILVLLLMLLVSNTFSQQVEGSYHFRNVDSLLRFAEKKSYKIASSQQEALLAKWTRVTAIFNTINIKAPVSFSMVDNQKLPVSYFPANIPYINPSNEPKEMRLGQQYVSTFSYAPQIDIVNWEYWMRVKSAIENEKVVQLSSLSTKKALMESVAACYYNIVSFKEQVVLLGSGLAAADSVYNIVSNKFIEGIVRQQDVNDALANKISLQDRFEQTKQSLRQQELVLKILCEIKDEIAVYVDESFVDFIDYDFNLKATSKLSYRSAEAQYRYLKAEYKSALGGMFPVLSLNASWSQQNFSNQRFFDSQMGWVGTNYIGFKASIPLPMDLTKLSQSISAKYKSKIAAINLEHSKIENDLQNKQLDVEYQKSFQQAANMQRIYKLKSDSYAKNLNLFNENVLPLDRLLTSFNDMVNSKVNFVAAQTNNQYLKTKVKINNQVQ